jgi:hypothetical protein
MFGTTRRLRKPREYAEARRLRREHGTPIKRIAASLGVSPGTVHAWTRDIRLTPEQMHRNLHGPRGPANPAHVAARGATWARKSRVRRLAYQWDGRRVARERDPLHMAGCMLYWAEGSKDRNSVKLANSDPRLVRYFLEFLRTCFDLTLDDVTARINCYTTPELPLEAIEEHWMTVLGLPRAAMAKATVNSLPTSSSGRKQGKLPYGVCTLRVKRSTWLVQHIYGAIQEYARFDEPMWLEGAARQSS